MPEAAQLRATPEMYGRVFDGHHEGRLILEDLTARFYDRRSYTPGGVEGARQTDFNEGRRAVVGFVLSQIGQLQAAESDDVQA